MAHVLTLALGPVQDFIAAAQRTRDFWFGSRLLSELARTAGKTILEVSGNRLVFPHPDHLGDEKATFTNKILAVLAETPGTATTRIRAAIASELAEIRRESFRTLAAERDAGNFFEKRAIAQIEDLIEIQWASAEFSGESDYSEARSRAEGWLGAGKNTRHFGPVAWGDTVPKSAIDGQRESVLRDELFDAKNGFGPEKLFRTYRVGPAERLCGVGLLKRNGRHKAGEQGSRFAHHFLSTAHLASLPLLERIDNECKADPTRTKRLKALWQAYLDAIRSAGGNLDDCQVYVQQDRHPILGAYDGGLLFENRLPDLFFEDTAEKRRIKAQGAQRRLREFLKEIGDTPRPYFAVLVADGDRMGQAIEAIETEERHRELSEQLTLFAKEAVDIVENQNHGELILAGGDDVLALVPLHRTVACGRQLASAFRDCLADFRGKDEKAPTLSVGVGISHFLEPLTQALENARRAEKLAKVKRDSLALVLDKRSGAPLEIAGVWKEIDLALDSFVTLHRESRIPDGLAFELRELARLPMAAPEAERQKLLEVVAKESRRILGQKKPREGRDPGVSDETHKELLTVYARLEAPLSPENLGGERLHEFADRMIVARLLAEASLQANPATEEAR